MNDKVKIGEWEICDTQEVLDLTNPILNESENRRDETECPKCHIEMVKSWNEYNLVCSKCSLCKVIDQEEHHTIGAGENHNTSSNAYMCFKPTGTKNRLYHNTMIKCTSVYEPFRNELILRLLKQYNFINESFKIPLNVIKNACERFIALRDHDYVRRGKTRRGVLGACIYVECIIDHITKTKTQIAQMLKVEESKITFGLEELQNYCRLGVIDLPVNNDPIPDYVDNLFEIFEIDQTKKTFIIELIDRMMKKKIEEVQNCFNITKCVGAVYFLSKLLSLGITHEQIALNCDNISRGTYLNVTNAIYKNEEKLRKVFVRHNMPMPTEWKFRIDKNLKRNP
jgi:transcription initiation factor TFIIIB Brf1 subunit/transcription initiation factor TFIIB